jgi:hypothetical protein
MNLALNPTTTSRTKHIDIKLHFIREIVRKGRIIIRYCPTEKQLADLLTKSLSRAKFEKLQLQLLGITEHDYILIPITNNQLDVEGGVSTESTDIQKF